MQINLIKNVTLIISVFIGISISQDIKSTIVLDDLIVEGIANNPQLHAFYTKSQADLAKIPQAGSLPDPMISLNILNLPTDNYVFDQEPMTGKQVAIKQKFPFPGKLGLKEQIAQKGADVSNANWQELKIQLIRNIKSTYYDLYFVDEAISTTEKNRELLVEFVNIAEQKYTVGKGVQQDVLKAQVELSKMLDRLINLKQKREKIEARLNALLNRKINQPFGKTEKISYQELKIDQETIEQLILQKRPLFSAWQLRIEQNDKKVALAKKQYWPDFSFFAAYSQRDVLQNGMGGADFLSAGITLDIPLYFWRKQRKQVEEKQLFRKSIEHSYGNIKLKTFSALDNAITDLAKNDERLELYETGIIPQAAQSLQSAMIGYQTDKVDFLTLVNNQMTLFNLELEYERILSEYNKNIAELEYLAGGELPGSNN
ncbi:MAG: TolC family protein [Calditrichaeota bacterium]|nr:MAG: TolC family protein [Calditrichota bacterium]MBL1207183.1 TolC family protein [Calditrichota bacterium]NOG47016.1 TolC family protein [Calditrichota bacterium]